MIRREFLLTGGTALSACLAGCADTAETENQRETDRGANSSQKTETELTTETEQFAIVAQYPGETTNDREYERQTVLTAEDITKVSSVERGDENQPPFIRVTLADESARRFAEVMNKTGFTDEGVGSCRWRQNPDDPGWCLLTIIDGNVTYAAGIGRGLASAFESGDYLEDPRMIVQTNTVAETEELRDRVQNETDE